MNLEFFFVVLTRVWVIRGDPHRRLNHYPFRQGNTSKITGTQIILWIIIVVSFAIDGRMHRFLPVDMPGSYTWLLPAALGILILGMAIRAVAVINLGKAFSANVATHAGQKLGESGLCITQSSSIFAHRVGLELIFLGLALRSRTWACLAVVLIPPTLAVLYRIHVEETALRRAFGAEYEEYSRSTKRLIPGVY